MPWIFLLSVKNVRKPDENSLSLPLPPFCLFQLYFAHNYITSKHFPPSSWGVFCFLTYWKHSLGERNVRKDIFYWKVLILGGIKFSKIDNFCNNKNPPPFKLRGRIIINNLWIIPFVFCTDGGKHIGNPQFFQLKIYKFPVYSKVHMNFFFLHFISYK